MTELESRLVTVAMRARRGVWSKWSDPCPPIAESDIRRWAIATYWPEIPPRLFWDDAYAKATRWGGIVAPEEFNPFAWPVNGRTGTARTKVKALGAASDTLVVHRLNGGCQMRFGARMRPGDRVRQRSRLDGWQPKYRKGSEMLLVDSTHEWRNQRDDLVREATYTLIYL